VESDIDVETHYYYDYDTAHASQWWYSNVIGSVNGLQATFSQDHNKHTTGQGYHDHVFTIDGTASESASSSLAGFIGTGMVDVAITGDDKLCAWWNAYRHIDTDTYGTVTATLTYNYTLRNVISFSGNVSFDHDQVVEVPSVYDCPSSLEYTFLSDTVSLSQFDPSLGILNSVELKVEPLIEVDTFFFCPYEGYHSSQWWYSKVIGSVNGLEATYFQNHENYPVGKAYYNHVFTIDGMASESASSGLAGFIGTGLVDVAITGDDRLFAWWNPYEHYDTDTYGTVTATLTYDYTPVKVDIKPETLNLKSKGVFTAFIELPEGYGEEDVDIGTVECEGAPALKATMANDGKLIVKFDREDLVGVLPGDAVELTVTGELTNGTPFAVSDTIRIID
jgi:hypothetical protein